MGETELPRTTLEGSSSASVQIDLQQAVQLDEQRDEHPPGANDELDEALENVTPARRKKKKKNAGRKLPTFLEPVRQLTAGRIKYNTDCPVCLQPLECLLEENKELCSPRCQHVCCVPCMLMWVENCNKRRLEVRCPLCNALLE